MGTFSVNITPRTFAPGEQCIISNYVGSWVSVLSTRCSGSSSADVMKIQGIAVQDLFRRATQMPTAMAIKSKSWPPEDYLNLLAQVAAKSQTSRDGQRRLHEDTVRQLQGPLAGLGPLHRQAAIDLFRRIGATDSLILARNYAVSGDREMALALALPDLTTPKSAEVESLLLDVGARTELSLEVANGRTVSPGTWSELFEWALPNYALAKQLWAQRPSAPDFMLSDALTREFLSRAGWEQDLDTMKEVAESWTGPADRYLTASLLHCLPFNSVRHVLENEYFPLADLPGRVFAANIWDTLAGRLSTCIGNALLQGVYETSLSHTVFHVHRMLLSRGFVPNVDTFQVLANAAYRLGNSKLVTLYLWREAAALNPANGTRKLFETLLSSQLVGNAHRAVFLYLREMRALNVHLRAHIQRRLYRAFEARGDAGAFVEMVRTPSHLESFDMTEDEVASESNPRSQALRNGAIYLYGWGPDRDDETVLKELLAFEKARVRP